MYGKRHRNDPDKYRRDQPRYDRARVFKAFGKASDAEPKSDGVRICKRDEKAFCVVFAKFDLGVQRVRRYRFVCVFKYDIGDVG